MRKKFLPRIDLIPRILVRVLELAVLMSLAFDPCVAQSPTTDPPLGQLVDVGGYRVHLYCTGEGGPSVIVVGGGFSFDWGLVQPHVAGFTKACTYDVSGTAWSDPGPLLTCRERVNEVHKLLKNARIEGPYVVVGLSVGALIARLYASLHLSEIAGLVIVDHAFIDVGGILFPAIQVLRLSPPWIAVGPRIVGRSRRAAQGPSRACPCEEGDYYSGSAAF
jgi:pimeloyl-ACP methyl ester carboxylesterase